MVNFCPLAAEICPVVWGTPANFNGFLVLAELLHGTPVVGSAKLYGVEQRAPPIFVRKTSKRRSHRSIQDHHRQREGSSAGFLQLSSFHLRPARSLLQASHKAQSFGAETELLQPTSRESLESPPSHVVEANIVNTFKNRFDRLKKGTP